jgi:hypothetical protein
LSAHILAQDHLPWFRRLLDPSGRIDSITIKIAVGTDRHVRDMNADP